MFMYPRKMNTCIHCKEIKPVHPKGDLSWIFIGMTDAGAEAPILWPSDVKSWLLGRDSDARKDWRQEKGTTEDEVVGCYHQLNGHEFEQALGVGGGQGSLVCCSPCSCKESDTTEWLNWLIDQKDVYKKVYGKFITIAPNWKKTT